MSEKIGFADVREGDRLRVRYVEGTAIGWFAGSEGVTRTLVSRAALNAFGRSWVDAEGHVLAHVGWRGMEIYRLVG